MSRADSAVGVPVSVVVPEGALSVDFTITTEGDLDEGQYDISATALGQTVPFTSQLTIDSSLPT